MTHYHFEYWHCCGLASPWISLLLTTNHQVLNTAGSIVSEHPSSWAPSAPTLKGDPCEDVESGATDDAIRHARRWRCDVCTQRPHGIAASPGMRPCGFNRHVHVDIKYALQCATCTLTQKICLPEHSGRGHGQACGDSEDEEAQLHCSDFFRRAIYGVTERSRQIKETSWNGRSTSTWSRWAIDGW